MCIWVCAFEYRYSWREVEWIFWSWNYRNLWPIWCGSSARAICTIHHLAIFPTLLECSLVIMMHLSLTIEVCILYSVDYSFAKSTGNTDFFFQRGFSALESVGWDPVCSACWEWKEKDREPCGIEEKWECCHLVDLGLTSSTSCESWFHETSLRGKEASVGNWPRYATEIWLISEQRSR